MINYFQNLGDAERPYWQSSDKDKATHFNHDLLVYGDYCNTGLVGKVNVESVLEDKELCERLNVIELHEMCSTTSLMFPIEALQDAELLELFERLERYPLLDDDAHSHAQIELENECWDSYGRRDFKRWLASQGYDIEETTDDTLNELYWQISNEANYGIGHEESMSWHFDFDNMGGICKDKLTTILNERLIKGVQ